MRKAVLGAALGLVFVAVSANAQISIDQMAPASAYDAGVLQAGDGGLDSALWQGVSAARATSLIKNIDTSADGYARSLIKSALLSGGVPPQAADNSEREAYIVARLSAVLALGELDGFDKLASQSGINPAKPVFTKIFVERALLGGDTKTACASTDTVTTGRKSPYWAKMRAFCHIVRGEMPAAELTSDLLSRSGHEDAGFFSLLGALTTPTKTNFAPDLIKTPLDTALARLLLDKKQIDYKILPPVLLKEIALDIGAAPKTRLWALQRSADIVTPSQFSTILSSLADAPLTDPKNLKAKVWDATTWGGAYLSLKNSTDMNLSTELAGALLAQADKAGTLLGVAKALETETGFISAEFQAKHNAKTFTRLAVLRRDMGTLRGLFGALDTDNPLRARIALASDALGNGFMLGELGVDIETRLHVESKDKDAAKIKSRAVRDSFIAVAMGAQLSETAEDVLRTEKLKGRSLNPTDLLALQAAARRGSKAEIALRAADMVDGKTLRADALAAMLTTLSSAGMTDQAGQLAALDILDVK